MMTRAQVQAARERADKATPGPWFCGDDGWPHRDYDPKDQSHGIIACWWSGIDESEGNPYRPYIVSFESLAFIAAARTDVPALAATVEALAEALSHLHYHAHADGCSERCRYRGMLGEYGREWTDADDAKWHADEDAALEPRP